jgi:uridine kinase
MTTIPVLERPHARGPASAADEDPPESAFSRAARELAAIPGCVEMTTMPAGSVIVEEGGADRDMYFVVAGRAMLRRSGIDLGPLGPGDHFGELALIAGRPRAASVYALTDLRLARLSHQRFEDLLAAHPAVALAFIQELVSVLGKELADMTDSVALLLRERSLPRRTQVRVRVGAAPLVVRTGTPAAALLPTEVGGRPVVAALIDGKPVPLGTPLASEGSVEPLTTAHWEGRKIYRASVGLLLLEAARRIDPDLDLRLGPSLGSGQIVEVNGGSEHTNLPALARTLGETMRTLSLSDAGTRQELWTVEEATTLFTERGWGDAAKLLATWRDPTVPLVSAGEVYALALGPIVPSLGMLRGFSIEANDGDLVLSFGDEDLHGAPGLEAALSMHGVSAARRREATMAHDHRGWLEAFGVTSVGAFNELCVSGKVADLIRMSEGFHEKRVGRIADQIAARRGDVRLISIAGPSSSGKTTFIKRLVVQLRIDGLEPLAISLDDYYLDREKSPRDENGEYDFEAFEALDIPLLQQHFARLLAGERVKTARYDFHTGKSQPEGGPELQLGPGAVLMLEGIHGLNPRLWSGAVAPHQVFRVFIEPATALGFDRLTRASVADLRLLRRIVRDRHQRGHTAAANIARWPSVRAGERKHIFPFEPLADAVYDSSLVYEPSVLKVFAERYLLEVPKSDPAFTTAYRLRQLIDRFVAIYPDHVPSTSILREFIGGSGWDR